MNQYRLETMESLRNYILGGFAVFTMINEDTGNRFTYRISRGKKNKQLYYVYVLTRSNNASKDSYKFLGGYSDNEGYIQSGKSPIKGDALSNISISWFFSNFRNWSLFKPQYVSVKFYHMGTCARCGKLLTTPESLKAGFGPECVKYAIMNGDYRPTEDDMNTALNETLSDFVGKKNTKCTRNKIVKKVVTLVQGKLFN